MYESIYYGTDNTRPTQSGKNIEFCKILKFGVNWASGEQDNYIYLKT